MRQNRLGQIVSLALVIGMGLSAIETQAQQRPPRPGVTTPSPTRYGRATQPPKEEEPEVREVVREAEAPAKEEMAPDFQRYILPGPPPEAIDPKTYVLGPGDVLSAYVHAPTPVVADSVAVSLQGTIYVGRPIGSLRVGGITMAEAVGRLSEAVRRYYRDTESELALRAVRRFPVQVTGWIEYPGTYNVPATTRLVQLMAHAGKILPEGSSRRLEIRREDGTVVVVDYARLSRGLTDEGNIELKAGDAVVVPRRGPVVNVSGAVAQPGPVEIVPGESLAAVLELGGGLTYDAHVEGVQVTRYDVPGGRLIHGDFAAILRGEPGAPTFELRDQDDIFVPNVATAQPEVVVEGEVRNPGAFPLTQEMRVSDVFMMAGNPGAKADLSSVRLERTLPNGERVPRLLNLVGLQAGEARDVLLEAGDRLIVPSFTERAGQIAVEGEFVARGVEQGVYSLREGETLTTFLVSTGGLKASADPYHIVLERQGPDGELERQTISWPEVRAGTQPDLLLQPGDRLVAKRRAEFTRKILVRGEFRGIGVFRTDEPAVATEAGQPMRQGTYDLAKGETLSQVIDAIGGFTAQADPRYLEIERQVEGQYRVIPVDFTAIQAGKAEDIVMEDGDILTARNRLLYRDQVTIVGEFVGTGVFDRVPTVTMGPGAAALTPERRGKVRIHSGTRLKDLIIQVGGLTAEAALTEAFVRRPKADGTSETIAADLLALLVFDDEKQNIELKNGDEIVVPRLRNMVYVVGEVHQPGAFPYREGLTVLDYFQQAGGQTNLSRMRNAYVVRRGPEGQHQVIYVDLIKALQEKTSPDNVAMLPGDTLVVDRRSWQGLDSAIQLVGPLALLWNLFGL